MYYRVLCLVLWSVLFACVHSVFCCVETCEECCICTLCCVPSICYCYVQSVSWLKCFQLCYFAFSGDSVALNPVTSIFWFLFCLWSYRAFFWRLDVWWNLDASVDVKMVTWRWDRNFIFPVLVQFLCSHICLSLQICFEHSAIDVGVHIASKYLHHLPSALATAVASFQLKIYLQNGQTAWFKSMQDQNHLYLSGPIHSWAHSCIYHNIYSLIQVYSWKARRYQVCAANSWV